MAPFKVAIIGGGISGLTTAMHLDKLGIDFVLLEKGNDIAPQVGASIGLFPNGLKILNQLGCYEDFMKVSVPVAKMTVRNGKGDVLYGHRILEGVHEKSGGYSVSFSERQFLLELMFRNLSDAARAKVLTGRRVTGIEEVEGGVKIRADGETFDADVVVGCDGVHSLARSEMWRWAEEDGQDVFAGDMGDDVPTEYGCVFGISSPTGDLIVGDDWLVHKKGVTVGVFVGPEAKLYWFVFFKLPQTYGLDFPRFTKEEEQRICLAEADAMLDGKTTFGDVYKNKFISVPTALPHFCLERWHYKRIMVIGDAVGKMNPIAGQGGCNCMETCVALVDNLHGALRAAGGALTSDQIDAVFAKTNEMRLTRVRTIMESGQEIQRVSAWSNWKNQFLDTYVAPMLPTWVFVQQTLACCKGAYESTTLRDGGIVVGSEEDKALEAAKPAEPTTRTNKRMSLWGPRAAQTASA